MRRLIWSVMVALALCAGPVWVEVTQSAAASVGQRAPGELIDLNKPVPLSSRVCLVSAR